MSGYWTIDVPVSSEIVAIDMPILQKVQMPEGVVIREMEVVLSGRIWRWKTVDTEVYGDLGARAKLASR